MNAENKSASMSLTRNSRLREMTASSIDGITQKLHEALPDLSANDITFLGLIGTAIGGAIASAREGNGSMKDKILTSLSLTTTTVSQLTDAVDGPLARLLQKEKNGKAKPNGQLIDVASDRLGELLLSLSRAITAEKHGDYLGTITALTVAVTSPLPSMARAYAESKGTVVPETGKGVMGLVGTRVGRAFLGILATEFPHIKGVPVQVIADMLSTTANIITTVERLKAQKKGEGIVSKEIQTDAQKRLNLLGIIGVGSVIAAGTTYALMRKK